MKSTGKKLKLNIQKLKPFSLMSTYENKNISSKCLTHVCYNQNILFLDVLKFVSYLIQILINISYSDAAILLH
jgi:hypothetical protein